MSEAQVNMGNGPSDSDQKGESEEKIIDITQDATIGSIDVVDDQEGKKGEEDKKEKKEGNSKNGEPIEIESVDQQQESDSKNQCCLESGDKRPSQTDVTANKSPVVQIADGEVAGVKNNKETSNQTEQPVDKISEKETVGGPIQNTSDDKKSDEIYNGGKSDQMTVIQRPQDQEKIGPLTTPVTETPEVSSTKNDEPPRNSRYSRRASYQSGAGGRNYGAGYGYQNYGLTYLPYKSNFEPSEDARRKADEFFKTLKL